MGRGQYTSVGGERGGRHRGGGERGGRHRGGGERGGRSWRGGWGGGWPYYSSSYAWPSYGYSYAAPSYSYALPAYDITDSGYVYPTGQLYAPSYSYVSPYYAPYYGMAATAFPDWRSQRFALRRHRRRIHHMLG